MDLKKSQGTVVMQKQVRVAGQAIIESAKSRKFSKIELLRLVQDLEVSKKRLLSREYKQSSFKARTTLATPDRTQELAQDLNFYWSVGAVWQQIVSKYFKSRLVSVAELGCGHISKVGLGLIYAGFDGHLTLIDQDRVAVIRAKECLGYFGSKFLINNLVSSVFNIKKKFDAILANHLLDDLILARYCKIKKINLARLYNDEHEYLKIWQEIVLKPDFLKKLAADFSTKLIESLNNQGLLVLLDYSSFSHKALSMTAAITLVSDFQQMLRYELLQSGAVEQRPILTELSFGRLRITKKNLLVFAKGALKDADK